METKILLERFAKRHKSRCPRSMNELAEMLENTFSGPVSTLSFEELFFHFIEEIGEVSEALADATTSEHLTGC